MWPNGTILDPNIYRITLPNAVPGTIVFCNTLVQFRSVFNQQMLRRRITRILDLGNKEPMRLAIGRPPPKILYIHADERNGGRKFLLGVVV